MKNGLVLEDHREMAQRMAALLAEAFPGITVTVAGSLSQARAAIHPALDIALLDLELPDGSGLDLIRDLLAGAPACRPIVMSLYGDDRHLFPALRAGALGYLLKSDPQERVVQSLQQSVAGEPPLSPAVALRILGFFSDGARQQPDETLSPRELEILTLVAKGYKVPEVAGLLGVAISTTQSYIKRIYQKLSISSRAEAALEAARRGLVGTQL